METFDLYFPFSHPQAHGFFVPAGVELSLFKYRAGIIPGKTLTAIRVHDVPAGEAHELIDRIMTLLPWAAVVLNHGIRPPVGEVVRSPTECFDGQFVTLHPSSTEPKATLVHGSHRGERPASDLFAALEKDPTALKSAGAAEAERLTAALTLFASCDFEASTEAQFVVLTTALEILADRPNLPEPCMVLVDQLISDARASANGAISVDDREALLALEQTASSNLKRRSIRQSIRALVRECAERAGAVQPDQQGDRAMELYDKRSNLVHCGARISFEEIGQLRRFTQMVLMIKVRGSLR